MIAPTTQHGKMLILMSRSPDKRWRPEEFMDFSLWELFVGYEANTRMSDLLRKWLVSSVRCKDVNPDYIGNKNRKCYKINQTGLEVVKKMLE